ncbi:MAG TPA: DinB family protein [Clostridia bacterium]|nr:DinB family protein [Clostridia bacterium]
MKDRKWILAVVLCAASAFAQQQSTTPSAGTATPQAQTQQGPPTVSMVLNRQMSGVESEIVSAADAMPETKFNFVPTNGEFKGVRNFGEQVRHVATTNYMIGAAIMGEKNPVPVGDNENGDAKYKTKAEIVQYLKDSFAYVHKAYNTIDENNLTQFIASPFGSGRTTRLGVAVLNQGHNFDHYGQIVEYLRMNGIIPPASRPR